MIDVVEFLQYYFGVITRTYIVAEQALTNTCYI